METFFSPRTRQIWGGGAVFLGNLDKIDTKKHFQTSDIFVNDILLIWAEVNFSKKISSLQHYKTQRLWNNSLIRIDRKPVYCSRMACKSNFASRTSYKRRHQVSLLYRIFKQISLPKLPTCLQWDYFNFKDIKEEFQR